MRPTAATRGTHRHSLVNRILVVTFVLLSASVQAEDLTVRARVRSEKVLVGQGVDLFVEVAAQNQRPKLEPPVLQGARIWVVEQSFRPTGMSAIGGAVMSDNVFTTRFRLVPTSPGRLDVPSILATLGERTGRSQPIRLSVETPTSTGRPPGFLGGIGEFQTTAEIDPPQVRVGQEATYRLRIVGPGAWGMTTAPQLERLRGLAIAPRLDARPDETVDEPPSRVFVFRIRPMKAGEVVLPPVSIASFDPRMNRYITRAARGVPLKVVAVPEYDADGLDYQAPVASKSLAWRLVAIATTILAAGVAIGNRSRLLRYWRRLFPAARRRRTARLYAKETARLLTTNSESQEEWAKRTMDRLAEFARLSVGRSLGALTPNEAAEAVSRASGSEELGRRAADVARRCDQVLFAARNSSGGSDAGGRLVKDAQALFEALGRGGGRRKV